MRAKPAVIGSFARRAGRSDDDPLSGPSCSGPSYCRGAPVGTGPVTIHALFGRTSRGQLDDGSGQSGSRPFDGAHLVQNFRAARSSQRNTLWSKRGTRSMQMSTPARRYMGFPGAAMSSSTILEIWYIVDNLFIGNRLSGGPVADIGRGARRSAQYPLAHPRVLLPAGDNITPPAAQAHFLDHRLYASGDDDARHDRPSSSARRRHRASGHLCFRAPSGASGTASSPVPSRQINPAAGGHLSASVDDATKQEPKAAP